MINCSLKFIHNPSHSVSDMTLMKKVQIFEKSSNLKKIEVLNNYNRNFLWSKANYIVFIWKFINIEHDLYQNFKKKWTQLNLWTDSGNVRVQSCKSNVTWLFIHFLDFWIICFGLHIDKARKRRASGLNRKSFFCKFYRKNSQNRKLLG